jgi:hypothetical protein
MSLGGPQVVVGVSAAFGQQGAVPCGGTPVREFAGVQLLQRAILGEAVGRGGLFGEFQGSPAMLLGDITVPDGIVELAYALGGFVGPGADLLDTLPDQFEAQFP